MTTELTLTQIANDYLEHCFAIRGLDIPYGIGQMCPEDAEEIIVKRWEKITRLSQKHFNHDVLGYLLQPPLVLLKNYKPGLLTSQYQGVIALLKDANRIYQMGRGLGKGFFILDATPLPEEHPAFNIDPNNLVDLVKLVQAKAASAASDVDELKSRLTEREIEVEKLRKEKQELLTELNNKYRTTWS
jgi:hypothetical protein